MNEKLKKLQERKSALLTELNNKETPVTEERMAEIETEIRNIEADEARFMKEEELRSRLAAPVATVSALPTEEREERAKKIMESGTMQIPAEEVRSALVQERATTIATDTLAKPTKTGSEIKDTMETVPSIVDQVSVVDLTGAAAYEEPYVKTESTAGDRTDGAAGTESDPVFRVAKIEPKLISTTAYVSKNIKRISPLAYEEKVRSLALKALRRKVSNLIVNGNAGDFLGIKIAANTKKEAICKELSVSSTTIDANTLRDIIFAYGGSDELGGNAVLLLTKQDLAAFGKVRGTNEKKPVYEITPDATNPNCGIIKDGGLSTRYAIHSGLTSLSTATQGKTKIQTMIYGDPKNFELGLFGPYTVEVSVDYKFAEGLLTIMGEVMAGGNVIVDGGFVIVTLAATA